MCTLPLGSGAGFAMWHFAAVDSATMDSAQGFDLDVDTVPQHQPLHTAHTKHHRHHKKHPRHLHGGPRKHGVDPGSVALSAQRDPQQQDHRPRSEKESESAAPVMRQLQLEIGSFTHGHIGKGGAVSSSTLRPRLANAVLGHTEKRSSSQLWADASAKHGNVSVVWRAAIGCDFSGFFVEVLGLLPALIAHIPRFYLDIGQCTPAMLASLEPAESAMVGAVQARSAKIIDRLVVTDEPYVLVQHKLPTSPFLEPRGNVLLRIGRTMSETARVAAVEVSQDLVEDELWVPTQWHVGVFGRAGIPRSKLFVLPEAIDLAFFTPAHPHSVPHARASGQPYKFLAVAKWEHRKGFDVLLRAFWAEFVGDRRDAVELHLRTYKPGWEAGPDDLREQFAELAMESIGLTLDKLPTVVWHKDDLTRKQLRDLYDASDAFVLPTRGEGWGLPIVEAMAMGLPTIATNFSGPTAYLTTRTGYPVAYKLNVFDGTAEPDGHDLQRKMREVFKHRSSAAAVGAAGQTFVRKHFSSENVAATIVGRIATLLLANPPPSHRPPPFSVAPSPPPTVQLVANVAAGA